MVSRLFPTPASATCLHDERHITQTCSEHLLSKTMFFFLIQTRHHSSLVESPYFLQRSLTIDQGFLVLVQCAHLTFQVVQIYFPCSVFP
ncbi:hypothetical protein BGZ61DRAFT_439641 [Ilyonectria robusta]|uniref:uncharacterized protein n=1 Tax=Ilyonectria robusta TaxID=1079257 RepID=UPI001E8EE7C1|nr:uncharacterized protein BGZ61DRAFT_439641 [Ilyonectria robusta]KAH8738131.1 hypothetical protein BGZ61DRAFT_439641 [Ilyonectria robusta]